MLSSTLFSSSAKHPSTLISSVCFSSTYAGVGCPLYFLGFSFLPQINDFLFRFQIIVLLSTWFLEADVHPKGETYPI